MSDLLIRALRPGETEPFLAMSDPAMVGVASIGREYPEYLAKGEYRSSWTWVAQRDGRTVARAAWWAGPGDGEPLTLDWFDFEDPADGEALLRACPLQAEYCLIVPAGWRDDPEVVAQAQARIDVVRRVGMEPLVERLRYRWTPFGGMPARPGRLEFRPEPNDDVIMDVLRGMVVDTLDAHSLRTIEDAGIEAAAEEEMEFLKWMPSPREWWRLAYTPAGELVGITVPGKNYGGPVVGLIGVLPDHRGNGYGYDLLVECTHLLAEDGATEIVADTDRTNLPMAAAFAKAGYPVVREQLFFV